MGLRGEWHVPTSGAEPHVGAGYTQAEDTSNTMSWFFVTWRGRVLDSSSGNVEARLTAIAEALHDIGQVGGTPAVRLLNADGVSFELWFAAAGNKGAIRGARLALKRAFAMAAVGDPNAEPGRQGVDVMVMLEEWPMLQKGES